MTELLSVRCRCTTASCICLAGRPSHALVAADLRQQLTESMLAAGEPAPIIRAALAG